MLLRMFRPLMILAVLLGTSLHAQLDPRLQKSDTDVLDVYQGAAANPELLTLFDFSVSMVEVFHHARYFSSYEQDDNLKTWPLGVTTRADGISVPNWYTIVPGDKDRGGWYNYDNRTVVAILNTTTNPWTVEFWKGYGTNDPTKMKNSNNTTACLITGARLVDRTGNLVSTPTTSSSTQSDVWDVLQKATHARATLTYDGKPRTVDLPLPYTVHEISSAEGTSDNSPQSNFILDQKAWGGEGATVQIDTSVISETNVVDKDRVLGQLTDDTWGTLASNQGNKSRYWLLRLFHYHADYLWWAFFGKRVIKLDGTGAEDTTDFVIPDSDAAKAFANGLPNVTRVQQLKIATISAWLENQDKVWWAIRFLDPNEQNKTFDNNNGSGGTELRNIQLLKPATASGKLDSGMRTAFTDKVPSTSTPLTHSMGNAYAQLTLGTSSSRFSADNTEGTSKGVPPCRQSFVAVFTDGLPNESPMPQGGDPYGAKGDKSASADVGLDTLQPGGINFNIWTLAGVAAQMEKPSVNSSTFGWAPFWVSNRPKGAPRKIRTMTVGMGLAGTLREPDGKTLSTVGGKAMLYRAALYGNPKNGSWTTALPPYDPKDTTTNDPSKNPFFFDARNPGALIDAMRNIVAEVVKASSSLSAPSSPLVGLSLGNQVYLGLFQTSESAAWPGDLVMTGLRLGQNTIDFVDKDSQISTSINSANAVWSAKKLLLDSSQKSWKFRKVLSTKPGTDELKPFEEPNTDDFPATALNTTDELRPSLIQFVRGAMANPASGEEDRNRTDIMGDIISSSPAVLEYPLSMADSSSILSSFKAANPDLKDVRFRVIFVGSNQGLFHAFGEVSGYKMTTLKDADGVVVNDAAGNPVQFKQPYGAVDELWSFFPPDFLKFIPALMGVGTGKHLYGVDGSPVVYFKDSPSATVSDNGKVTSGDDVRVIIGLRKGGRSYYAFDVKDPFNPLLAWRLRADEHTEPAIKNMGYATSTPAVARVNTGTGSTVRDLLFLGGGLSTANLDAEFGAKLGRSLIAVDVMNGPSSYTNGYLQTWDFTASPLKDMTRFQNMGSISTGVAPMEFLPNTGKTQRVYFADQPTDLTRGSAVFALGSVDLATNNVFRLDNSWVENWKLGTGQGVRKIYQAVAGRIISTTPVPFRLDGPIPNVRTVAPTVAPAAVGVAVGLGDRNDPMDRDSINPPVASGSTPGSNRFVVAFDRQDSYSLPVKGSVDASGLVDTDLIDLTGVSALNDPLITPGSPTYFLKTGFGYYLTYPGGKTNGTGGFYYPKTVNASSVLNGVLLFSIFTPGTPADATGNTSCLGQGQTDTYRICNVMGPLFNLGKPVDGSTFNSLSTNCSGIVLSFANIAGELTSLGTSVAIQSGQGKTTTGDAGLLDNAGAQVGGVFGKKGNFAFRPRAWRIVR